MKAQNKSQEVKIIGHKIGHNSNVTNPAKEPSAKKSYAKTDARYWKDRVEKFTRKIAGEVHVDDTYSVRLHFEGRRERFNLGTADKGMAAAKAAEIYKVLDRDGWQAALDTFKPKSKLRIEKAAGMNMEPTVGDFIAEVEKMSRMRKASLAGCCRCFRTIVAGVAGIEGDKSRYDYKGGGAAAWRAKVDSVKLSTVTPEKVKAWQNAYVAKAGEDPEAERRAKISANSFRRQAGALFSDKSKENEGVLSGIRKIMRLPDELPFSGVKGFGKLSMKYQSKFNALSLLSAARDELAPSNPEAFKVLVLALCCGLRRNEIDKLMWLQVDLDKGVLRIEPTKHFRPKSQDSIGDVDLDPEIVALMRGWKAKGKGAFVVESEVLPRLGGNSMHYRTNCIMNHLGAWLRTQGVQDRKFLHVLRKEFGSLVAQEHGIYAASRALRHGDIQVTAQHYLDKKSRISVGLGALLAPAAENIVSADFGAGAVAGAGADAVVNAKGKPEHRKVR
jgi:integrase